MKISYNWLKEYVYFYLSPQELADRLTNVGLVVADIKPVEDDFCLDIEVTSNRPDCLGIIGIAREVAAAAVGGSLHFPETHFVTTNTEISKFITIIVEEPILCPRYTARVIRHITVENSPEWMQKRLKCIGLRPVNNIVDITNYVMMETGQPLHAFDLDKLAEQKIIVRKARSGEEIVTINGARRALFHDMLVIADGRRPVAVAGIMGGKETEVSESTRNILLECAQFEPRQVRRTSRALGIASDSSYRFERGIDPEGIDRASQRAAKLIKDYASGEIACGVIDKRTGRQET
ncbi:MAG: phenylalanine--tRNA ligase beta subunit-related protein, partial [Candidatus Brocadia sp.]